MKKGAWKNFLVCFLGVWILNYGGLNYAATLHVPWNYQSIQAAINATNSGDTVLVHDGIYYENIWFNNNSIIVRSVNGPATTIINPFNSGSVVTFDSGDRSVLDGFRITHGNSFKGGGISCWWSSPTIKNCIIYNNTATWGGGIACAGDGSPMIINCTIVANSARGGGGIDCIQSWPTIINCTIADNAATNGCGGITCVGKSSQTLINNIIWGNIGNEICYDESSYLSVIYSNIEGGWTGEGNIDVNPLFLGSGEEGGDYHLTTGSPCIDGGTNNTAPNADVDGESRPFDVPGVDNNGILPEFDMGADEYVDSDGDGVPDYKDNCPTDFNQDQGDSDSDGIGDVCDVCTDNSDCDDGVYCNGIETCVAENCELGVNPCSDDVLFCNGSEWCDEINDLCFHTGNPCQLSTSCNEATNICDADYDGVPDGGDNCLEIPNGPSLGTCIAGTRGLTCTSNEECGTSGLCSMSQEDTYPPLGNCVGDACECEGNFDCDKDVDGSDAFVFKSDFGRSLFLNPCPNCVTMPWCIYP